MKTSQRATSCLLFMSIALPTYAAEYAPLNCGKTVTIVERAICSSYPLGQSEARMATLYGIATSLVAMGRRGDLEQSQKAWLETRNACGPRISCLKAQYLERIGALQQVINDIASRGPY
jgi:uncharacterized protein